MCACGMHLSNHNCQIKSNYTKTSRTACRLVFQVQCGGQQSGALPSPWVWCCASARLRRLTGATRMPTALTVRAARWRLTTRTPALQKATTTTPAPKVKKPCEENPLILQLARLSIFSPERIVMLLATSSVNQTCENIDDVLQRMNRTMASCVPLPSDNLFMKLRSGLIYFSSYICQCPAETMKNKQHLVNHQNCIKELRPDFLDCEGPADWFEHCNKTIVCQFYNDIVNCNYIKTGMLCGLKPALLVRTFSEQIMKIVVKDKCKLARSLPHIDDPMPLRGHRIVLNKCRIYIRLFSIILIIYLF